MQARRLDEAVITALGIDPTGEDRSQVERADRQVGGHELAEQFPSADHDSVALEHDPARLSDEAGDKAAFLNRARGLGLE